MSDENGPGENELSRLFNLGDLGRHGVIMEIAAGPEERAALARRFDLVAVDSLVADVTIVRDEEDHMVQLRGSIAVEVVQACVATLEPVASLVKGAMEMASSTEAPAAGAPGFAAAEYAAGREAASIPPALDAPRAATDYPLSCDTDSDPWYDHDKAHDWPSRPHVYGVDDIAGAIDGGI